MMVVTNAVGVAFAAALLSASDTGAVFVFPEDGATNELRWAQLAPASREAVCDALDFAPVPPAMAATFARARKDLRRLANLTADGRIDAVEAARRREGVRRAFATFCREKGIEEPTISRLLRRLERPAVTASSET